jgi:hypothetical protein
MTEPASGGGEKASDPLPSDPRYFGWMSSGV